MDHAEKLIHGPDVQGSGAVIAALDLLHARERDADHVANDLAGELERRCGVDAVLVATHAAVVGTLRHVALAVEVRGIDASELRDVLAARLPADGVAGLLVENDFQGQPELRPVLAATIDAHRTRSSGRVVVFAGHRELVGSVSVADVRAHSAIEEIRVLGNERPADDTMITTRDFVRPRWRDRRLVLDTQPALGDTLVPFETPTPTPCCVDHA